MFRIMTKPGSKKMLCLDPHCHHCVSETLDIKREGGGGPDLCHKSPLFIIRLLPPCQCSLQLIHYYDCLRMRYNTCSGKCKKNFSIQHKHWITPKRRKQLVNVLRLWCSILWKKPHTNPGKLSEHTLNNALNKYSKFSIHLRWKYTFPEVKKTRSQKFVIFLKLLRKHRSSERSNNLFMSKQSLHDSVYTLYTALDVLKNQVKSCTMRTVCGTWPGSRHGTSSASCLGSPRKWDNLIPKSWRILFCLYLNF